MRANDVRSSDPLRHGAYICLRVPDDARRAVASAAVPALAARLGLQSEFAAEHGHPAEAIAFLRRVGATAADIVDDELRRADVVVHVASATAGPVARFCAEIADTLGSVTKPYVIGGVVRPLVYTGHAMHNFSYAHRVLQQPGPAMPNAFLVPMSKTPAWWSKGWMERHTYFLPKYDDAGQMVNQGHALASEAGIACLMRRTYKHPVEPAPAGTYDFVTYFECADADVPTFHEVCAALRDTTKNPEWRYVREGPTWQGRRVATWAELFAMG
jgi:hypothetical protein